MTISTRLSLAAALMLSAGPLHAADLVIGSRAEPVLDPHYQWSDTNQAYYKHIYGGLTTLDTTSQVQPGLAESWDNPEPNVWEFHLRDGVKFTDGSDATAQDVVGSFDRMRTIKAAATYAGAVSRLDTVEAVDDHTVRMTFTSPNPLAPAEVASIQIIPSEHADATSEDFADGSAAVGFGPYKVANFRPGESIVLERNPDFYGTPAEWDQVTFRFIADAGARVSALLGSDVDVIDAVPPSLVQRIDGTNGYHVISGQSGRAVFLTLDSARDQTPFVWDVKTNQPLAKNPLKDVRVRQALSHAIDRQAIADRVMGGLGYPASQITPQGFGGYNDELEVPSFDPERSRKLLAEAGYPDGFGIQVNCTSDRYVEDARICQALGQMFSRIGLTPRVETLPAAVHTPRAMDPNGERFSLAMLGWTDAAGEAKVLNYTIHSPVNGYGTWNWGPYSNPELDALLDDANGTMDADQRHVKLAQVMKMAMDDAAVIPLHYQSVILAARDGLTYQTWLNEYTVADSVTPVSQ